MTAPRIAAAVIGLLGLGLILFGIRMAILEHIAWALLVPAAGIASVLGIGVLVLGRGGDGSDSPEAGR